MTWYTKFGLQKNPFTTDPFAAEYTFVNYSEIIDELLYHCKAGNMCILEGKNGVGKTMMLRQVINVFGGKGKVLYVDGKKFTKTFDIEHELNAKGTPLFNKILGKKPQRIIVLLDNAEYLTSINMQKLKYYFDQDYVQSIIFTTTNITKLSLSQSIQDRIGPNIRTIPPMINYDALRIIRDRFADHFFLPDYIILRLFKLSNNNIKQLLVNCEKVCSHVVSLGKGEVLPKYIPQTLMKKSKTKQDELQPSKEESKPLAKEV